MKDFLTKVKEISFFSRHAFYHAACAEFGAQFFFVSRLLLGLLLAVLAAILMLPVKNCFLGALLATVCISVCRDYLLNWRDRDASFKLLEQFLSVTKISESDSRNSQFLNSLRHWIFLLRPLLYFMVLASGGWFLVLPVTVLASAFGFELRGNASEFHRQRGWLFCVAFSLLVTLLGGLCATSSRCLAVALLTCALLWLLAKQIKDSPWCPADLGTSIYLGELLCLVAFMLGLIF